MPLQVNRPLEPSTGERFSLVAALCFGLVAPVSRAAAAPPGPGLVGPWQVEHVLGDRGATHKVVLREDDPRLVGRLLTIGSDEVLFRTLDTAQECKSPSLEADQTTAGALIRQTMAGRGGPPVTPTPGDYGLGLEASAPVEARWLSCGSGNLGPGFVGRKNTWFVDLPEHRLAMGYFGSTVLVLEPVAAGTAPVASFPCARAVTLSEKAICGSLELATLDRSVATSFASDLKQFTATEDPAAAAKLRSTQKEWLAARDRCDEDAFCLRRSMTVRVLELADTATFTGE